MKLAVISDLHLDFWEYSEKTSRFALLENIYDKCRAGNPDRIIVAGDFWDGYFNFEPCVDPMIFEVYGNHDFYGCHWDDYCENLWFHGGMALSTLWSGFQNSIFPGQLIMQQISDDKEIDGLSVERMMAFFESACNEIADGDPDIIVTHFPPSRQSVHPRYDGNPLNPYFTNDLDNFILERNLKAKLWVCGHVHHKHEYYIGDMRVVCNPCGYPGENHRRFADYEPLFIRVET